MNTQNYFQRTLITLCVLSIISFVRAQNFGGGDGSVRTPYVIETAEHLNEIRNYADMNFELGCDVEMEEWLEENFPEQGWLPIPQFTGTIDGAGFSIKGLWIDRPGVAEIGLFSKTAVDPIISNLGLILGEKGIKGENNTAAFVGLINGGTTTIEQCFVIGEIYAEGNDETNAGGFVGGFNAKNLNLFNCYFIGSVEAHSTASNGNAGALLGLMYGKSLVEMKECYALGTITASHNAGGLVGFHGFNSNGAPTSLRITNCAALNSAIVGTVNVNRVLGANKPGNNKEFADQPGFILTDNIAFEEMTINGEALDDELGTGDDVNGLSKTKNEVLSAVTYDSWINKGDGEYPVWEMGKDKYTLPLLIAVMNQPTNLPEYLDGGTNISSTVTGKMVVYPNPTTDKIFIVKEDLSAEVCIYDVTGKEIYKSNESVINVSSFAQGLYLVQVEGNLVKVIKK